jgi:DNA polymerase-1
MVDVASAMRQGGLSSVMTLQIHDELIFDVAPSEVEAMRQLVNDRMTGAVTMRVPLKVDIGVYDNWGEAKE